MLTLQFKTSGTLKEDLILARVAMLPPFCNSNVNEIKIFVYKTIEALSKIFQ